MIDNLHSIPRELVELPNWVCWGVEIETPKKPHNPRDLTPAKAGAPSTWGSFEQAVTCATEGKAQGVGFEFDGSSFVGVDLDHCLNAETGEITHWASEIVQSLDSYTEISMSGTGLHIFIKGQKPGKQCKKVLNKETGEAVEIYDNGRYFAMTGRIFNETSIVERTAELGIIYERLFSIEESAHNSVDIPSGLQVGLKRDRKLIAIWNGQRDSTDESGNDMSLMNKLAYWCNRDKEAMIKAFLASPFAAQKDEAHKNKLQREDYLSRTADGAIANCWSIADDGNKRRKSERKGLNAISAPDLQNSILPPVNYLIDGFLPAGTSILTASPKSGKSWLVLLMGLRIALGEIFLKWETRQVGVLYLSFEDTLQRLQSRMNKLLDNAPAPPWFYFSTDIITLEDGLLESVDEFISENQEIKLVIIDTFQKIRGQSSSGEGWYSHDYREVGALKEHMDKRGVSVLFVHHTSKAKDKDDPFNEISGTNGISGAVDTMFVLKKESRHAREATLHITGRDIEQDELVIRLNEENCQWEFVGDADELAKQEALSEYQISPIVKTIRAVLNESSGKRWSGSAKNLIEAGERIFKIPIAPSSQSLSSKLKGIKDLLNEQDKIVYTISPNGNAGYRHHFHYIVEVENPIVATDHDDEAVNFLN